MPSYEAAGADVLLFFDVPLLGVFFFWNVRSSLLSSSQSLLLLCNMQFFQRVCRLFFDFVEC